MKFVLRDGRDAAFLASAIELGELCLVDRLKPGYVLRLVLSMGSKSFFAPDLRWMVRRDRTRCDVHVYSMCCVHRGEGGDIRFGREYEEAGDTRTAFSSSDINPQALPASRLRSLLSSVLPGGPARL